MVNPVSSASIPSISPAAPSAAVSQSVGQSSAPAAPAADTVSISPQAHAMHDGDSDGH